MRLFWRQGFEATSISDLTAELGINPPSLYAAFGDKEQLFREAAQQYQQGADQAAMVVYAEAPTARAAVMKLLEMATMGLTRPGQPNGCMLVTAAGSCSAASPALQAELVQLRAVSRRRMQARLKRAVEEGELPAETDAAALARFYSTIIQGMTTQRVDGATRKELQATAQMAMRAWPA
jgi:AcrR family transcriptional regulator